MLPFLASSHPFFSAYAQADFLGKLIFLALTALSILSWVILIQKVWKTRMLRRLSMSFQQNLIRRGKPPLSPEIQDLIQSQVIPHPFLRLFLILKQKTSQILEKNRHLKEDTQVALSSSDIDFVESHLYSLISAQVKDLGKHLHVLFTIVSLAPFLGLLGTVWGILITFSEMQAHAGNTSQVVLGGLSMALATTVYGLIVAIPALVAYNYLKQMIQDFESEMEHFSSKLLASVELQYRKP